MAQAPRERPSYPVGSVESALRLIQMVVERKHIRIADASRELGFARSTGHRLLQTLEWHGFVEQDPETKAFRPGPVLIGIGLDAARGLDIRRIVRATIEALAEDVGETVHLLGYRNEPDLVCLDSVESPHALRVGGRVGMTLPVHSSAAGRVILSHRSPKEITALYPNSRLPAHHPKTITTRSELVAEIERTRERGFGIQHGETEAGISAIAAAVIDHAGRCHYAITVAIPSSRLEEADIPQIAARTVASAAEIGSLLPW